MRRSDFLEITTWDDLEESVEEMGNGYIIGNIHTEDDFQEIIKGQIDANWRYDSIWDIGDFISNLPSSGHDRYEECDGDWYGTNDNDSTFEDYKQRLFDAFDCNDDWDEEEPEELEDEPDEPPLEDEPIDIMDVIDEAQDAWAAVIDAGESFVDEIDKAFAEHFDASMSKSEPEPEAPCDDSDIDKLFTA